MDTHSVLVVTLSLVLASAGCSAPGDTNTDTDTNGADACVPHAMLPADTCVDGVLSRHDAPTELRDGPATVVSLDVEPDGRASLVLEADGVSTTLSLPAAPMAALGDTLTVELDPSGAIILRSDDDLLVYIGPRALTIDAPAPVDYASLLEANREGVPLSIDVVGFPLTLEASCGGWVLHQGATLGCPDVPMAAFSVRYGGTTVAPGARAIALLEGGGALAIENRGVHVREAADCGQCADLWWPGFGVTLVPTVAE